MERIINLNEISEEILCDETYEQLLRNANWNIQGGKRNYSDFKNLLYYTYRFLKSETSDLFDDFVENIRKSLKFVDHGPYTTVSVNPYMDDIVYFDGYSFEVRDEVELLKLLKWCEDFKQNYDKEHPKKNLPKVKSKGENLEIMDTILKNLVRPEDPADYVEFGYMYEAIAHLNKNCKYVYNHLLKSRNEKKLDAFRKLINSPHFIIREVTGTNYYGEEEIIGYQLDCQSRAVRNFIKSYRKKIANKSRRQAIQISNKDTMELVDILEEEDELTK